MQITTLEHIDVSVIINCFLEAFANYFIPLPSEHVYYETRWAAAVVRYDLSYGVFEKGQLIAFIIHAIDERAGETIAYNTGTGVLPNYRGKGLVKQLYHYALQDLKAKGIRKTKLEVIQKNSIAISCYQKLGFQIVKELWCYKGVLQTNASADIQVEECSITTVNWDKLPKQDEYAWDFQKETLCNGGYRFYYILHKGKRQSYFVLHENNGMLAQFDLLEYSDENWGHLFDGIAELETKIRINNLSITRRDKKQALEKRSFENTINQYEMLLNF